MRGVGSLVSSKEGGGEEGGERGGGGQEDDEQVEGLRQLTHRQNQRGEQREHAVCKYSASQSLEQRRLSKIRVANCALNN